MQLTKHTDYAFRTLLFLAVSPAEQLATARQIADTYDMAYNHVVKVVNKLARAGLIESTRGRQGGLRIQPKALTTTAADVVTLMEQTLEPANCTNPQCAILSCCTLRTVLDEAQNRFLEHLSDFTIADLVKTQRSELTSALKIRTTKPDSGQPSTT